MNISGKLKFWDASEYVKSSKISFFNDSINFSRPNGYSHEFYVSSLVDSPDLTLIGTWLVGLWMVIP